MHLLYLIKSPTVQIFESIMRHLKKSARFQKKCTIPKKVQNFKNIFIFLFHVLATNMERPTAVSTEHSAPTTGLGGIDDVKALLDTVNSDIQTLANKFY